MSELCVENSFLTLLKDKILFYKPLIVFFSYIQINSYYCNIKHFCKQQSLLSFNEFRKQKIRSDKGN